MHILNGIGFEFQSIIILRAQEVNPASATGQKYRIDTKVSGRQHCTSIMLWRAPEGPASQYTTSCTEFSPNEHFYAKFSFP